MLNGLKNKLCCVRGNCEAEVDQMVLDLPVMADYCILPAGEKLIYATHGHIYNGKNPPPLAEGTSCSTATPTSRRGRSSGRGTSASTPAP